MPKLPVATEHDEQVAVFEWAKWMERKWPELKSMYAIPNGGLRNVIVARKLKDEGVKPGVPDICLPVMRLKNHGYSGADILDLVYGGLYVEMKRAPPKYVRPGKTQRDWHKMLKSQGYCVEIAKGADDAIKILTTYLEGGY